MERRLALSPAQGAAKNRRSGNVTERIRPSVNGDCGNAAAVGLLPDVERWHCPGVDELAGDRVRCDEAARKRARWPDAVYVSELSAEAAAVDFLWEGCVARGHLTLLSALMKAGKSTLLGHFLRAL